MSQSAFTGHSASWVRSADQPSGFILKMAIITLSTLLTLHRLSKQNERVRAAIARRAARLAVPASWADDPSVSEGVFREIK